MEDVFYFIVGLGFIFLVIWYHIRLLSDKTDYAEIRKIVREEIELERECNEQ